MTRLAMREWTAAAPFFAIVVALLFLTCASSVAVAANGLTFEEKIWNFGKITTLDKREHIFKFRNTGKKNIKIISVTPSCGCTAAVLGKKNFRPGEHGEIKVVFDPGGKSGWHESTVAVATDKGQATTLAVTAEIETLDQGRVAISAPTPSIRVIPESVDLGKLKEGGAVAYKIVVENAGDGELFIQNVMERNDAGVPLSHKPIGKNKKVEITFFYRAMEKGGIKEEVVIHSNDPVRPEVAVPVTGTVD